MFCVHSWTSRTGGFGDKIDFYFVFFYSFDSYAVDVFPMKNKIRKTEKNVWKNRNLFVDNVQAGSSFGIFPFR